MIKRPRKVCEVGWTWLQFHQAYSTFMWDCSWWRGANERLAHVGKTSHNRSNVTWRYTFSATALSRGVGLTTVTQNGQLWETENLARRANDGCQLRQHVHYYHSKTFFDDFESICIADAGLNRSRLTQLYFWRRTRTEYWEQNVDATFEGKILDFNYLELSKAWGKIHICETCPIAKYNVRKQSNKKLGKIALTW